MSSVEIAVCYESRRSEILQIVSTSNHNTKRKKKQLRQRDLDLVVLIMLRQ